jgi:hypothetical protein
VVWEPAVAVDRGGGEVDELAVVDARARSIRPDHAAVFLAFVTGSDTIGKMFVLGLGLAILIDVLIVRMAIAPAVVTLLGDRAWWLPAWLHRLLPNVSLEGRRETTGAGAGRVPEPEKVPV